MESATVIPSPVSQRGVPLSERLERVYDVLQPIVNSLWQHTNAHLSADNPSAVSNLLRIVVTLLSYWFLYIKVAGMVMWGIMYLTDHGWYILTVTCSTALLLFSSVLLAAYEWMWRWQELIVPTRRTLVTVEDEDDESMRYWLKKLWRLALILLAWSLYCVANTKLDVYIWNQYLIAHPDHDLEIMLVNWLEGIPILVGAAFTMFYLYPPFYTWHYSRTSLSTSGEQGENPRAAMQSLL